ncbi:uncharacterized protein K02A2.6-like [Nasonia vitripennis]|uniref:CCHC-type domain-containing protein n=1 Tax=Nasonia vitripennis TaxID=7425 RepID=A0A7M7QDY2_NASVI|nr:uncharacterized protein K02A2.6-like [Nasonia vitripennis]
MPKFGMNDDETNKGEDHFPEICAATTLVNLGNTTGQYSWPTATGTTTTTSQSSRIQSPAQHQIVPTSYGTYLIDGQEYSKTSTGFVPVSTYNGGITDGQSNIPSNTPPPTIMQVPVVNFAGNIGRLEEFKINSDWNIYHERLEQYFNANFVDDARKVSVLITAIGPEVYKILRNLCDPQLPHDKPYTELCEILSKQFSPRISIFQQRKRFYDLQQNSGESISQWYARIKKGAVHCDFGTELEGRIKDKFVTGMKEGKILDRICERSHKDALKDIYETALAKEASLAVSANSNQCDVNKLTQHNRGSSSKKNAGEAGRGERGKQQCATSQSQPRDGAARQQGSSKQQKASCNHCGGVNHVFSKCKYKTYKCNNCSKKGHISKVCKEPKNGEVKYLEDGPDTETNYISLHNIVDREDAIPPIQTDVFIEGKRVVMEIDSGAGVTIIPFEIYKKKQLTAKIEKCQKVIKTYDNRPIKPIGQIVVDIIANDVTVRDAKIIIIKENRQVSLMGRDLMNKLNISLVGPQRPIDVKKIDLNSPDDLKKLLNKYADLFDGQLGKLKGDKVHLKLSSDAKPVFLKPNSIPFAFKSQVESDLKRLQDQGVIEKIDTNDWGTPLVPVLKEDNTVRTCANYKKTINPWLVDHRYPIPRIEEIFSALKGGEEFTKLDLEWAYNQIEVDEETSRILAWSTHMGVFKVKRLSFGPKTACSIFQEKIEGVVRDLQGCKNYFDDLIVTGKDRKKHLENLENVLKALKDHGLKLRKNKCEFMKPRVFYLGHIIDKNGLSKNPENVKAIVEIKRPTNVQEIQAFAGMVNYYMKFIPNLSTMLSPIYKLLKKDTPFVWSKECEQSFNEIKRELAADRNLVHYDPDLEVKLTCDASNVGIGSVLSHVLPNREEKPICFASRTLTKSERNYSVIQKEALAIYWSVKKFYQYLIGRPFILESDHKPLLAIFGEKNGLP